MSEQITNQSNPLSAYFRAPKLYLKLLSGANYYNDDVITRRTMGLQFILDYQG